MAAFQYVVQYDVTATCVSPLRTGSVEGNAETILMWDGYPMIQGSSIAGVLRSGVAPDLAERLFGSPRNSLGGDTGSLVTVSDGIFDAAFEEATELRPRLKMDGARGSGEDRKKFDLRGVKAGKTFSFSIWLKTMQKDPEGEAAIRNALAALHTGKLLLGAQKSNGFGRVRLEVRQRVFDLKGRDRLADRIAWRDGAKAETPLYLVSEEDAGISLVLTGTADSFLIRSNSPARVTDKKSGKPKDVAANHKNEAGDILLPGSAVKGILRDRAAMIARFKNRPELVEALFGTAPAAGSARAAAGQLRVRESVVKTANTAVVTRVTINRITGGTMRKRLFEEQLAGGEVSIRVDLSTGDDACCGLLFCAMHDLALGLYNFGGEGSVGRGRFSEAVLEVRKGDQVCTIVIPPIEYNNGVPRRRREIRGSKEILRPWLAALDEEVSR